MPTLTRTRPGVIKGYYAGICPHFPHIPPYIHPSWYHPHFYCGDKTVDKAVTDPWDTLLLSMITLITVKGGNLSWDTTTARVLYSVYSMCVVGKYRVQYGVVRIKQIFSYTFYSDVKYAILIKSKAAEEKNIVLISN